MGPRVAEVNRMFTAAEVVTATGGRLIRGEAETAVGGISIDSRTVRPGDLFMAIKGERFDGHEFVYEALERGACGLVVNVADHRMSRMPREEGLLRNKMLIGVSDTLAALQGLSHFHRRRWDIPVVGVTGSNGKTTTKDMISAILERRYATLKTEGNLNNQIGVPLTLFRLTSTHEAAVLEMGMNHEGEIRRLADLAMPRVGLITNIGPAHLEHLGNLEAIARAKSELLEALSAEEGIAVLNRDDPFYEFLKARSRARVVSFGTDPSADVVLAGWEPRGAGSLLRLTCRWAVSGAALIPARPGRPSARVPELRLELPFPGAHNAMNAAAAAAAGLVLGCGVEEIRAGLERSRAAAMRSEVISWEGRTILNDAYNANPASMRAAIDTLCRFPVDGKRIAVLGDMKELGASAPEAHREAGRFAAASGIDRLLTLGEDAEILAREAQDRGMGPHQVTVFREPADLAAALKELTRPGDLILIKGSRAMKMERILAHLGLER